MAEPGALPSIVCETPRLILRQVAIEDADITFRTSSQPEVARFIGGPMTFEWHLDRTRQIIEHQRLHGFGRWSVFLKDGGEQIGRCGLMYKEISSVPEVELGYTFSRANWGKGYATEAATAALQHAFRRLAQKRIVAIIHPGNRASIRVAEKIGMSFERMIEWDSEPAKLYVAERCQTSNANDPKPVYNSNEKDRRPL